jgi:hypothetical protein
MIENGIKELQVENENAVSLATQSIKYEIGDDDDGYID